MYAIWWLPVRLILAPSCEALHLVCLALGAISPSPADGEGCQASQSCDNVLTDTYRLPAESLHSLPL